MERFLFHDPNLGVDVYAVDESDIPPPPPRMRKDYWDSVIRDVIRTPKDKVWRITFSKEYWAETMESSVRKAAARAGVKISVTSRSNKMYLWPAAVGKRPGTSKRRRKSPKA